MHKIDKANDYIYDILNNLIDLQNQSISPKQKEQLLESIHDLEQLKILFSEIKNQVSSQYN